MRVNIKYSRLVGGVSIAVCLVGGSVLMHPFDEQVLVDKANPKVFMGFQSEDRDVTGTLKVGQAGVGSVASLPDGSPTVGASEFNEKSVVEKFEVENLAQLTASEFESKKEALGVSVSQMQQVLVQAMKDKRQLPEGPAQKVAQSLKVLVEGPSAHVQAALMREGLLRMNGQGQVGVTIRLSTLTVDALEALRRSGVNIRRSHAPSRIVEGFVEPSLISSISQLEGVQAINATHSARASSQGNAQTLGDSLMRADLARAGFQVSGQGVKICVISDGVLGAAQAAQVGELPLNAQGELAVELCPVNAEDNFLGAEGTAMLEIVHDLAPGATLGFCSGFSSPLGMADAIEYLSKPAPEGAGCDVVVDDLGFYAEPYFQDGVIASAAEQAVRDGAVFVSAAGNSASSFNRVHYEGGFRIMQTEMFNQGFTHVFSEDPQTGESNPYWMGILQPGGTAVVALQWAEPFGRSARDMDVYLFDQEANLIQPEGDGPLLGFNGTSFQRGFSDPMEFAVVQNLGDTPQAFFVLVHDYLEANIGIPIEMFVIGSNFQMDPAIVNPAGSIFGHPAVPQVISVGAINASEPGVDEIAPYSSQGPSRVFFTSNGRTLNPRNLRSSVETPSLVGIDGVSVSGLGGFPTTFFGTSAAAPHVAAVAALMLEANPGLTPQHVGDLLKRSAVARGTIAQEYIYGAGLVDAQAAVKMALETVISENNE